jgi:hypothetical protein
MDPNSGGLERLHDGRLPDGADDPSANFFFAAGTPGGRLELDLGQPVEIKQVNTYSWHPATRGSQVYQLYASDGRSPDFNPAPQAGIAPGTCGWTFIADVNTKPQSGTGGGQYGVSIYNPAGNLGRYRYLLFDMAATERNDPFGNTFYSEIDVVDANAKVAPEAARPMEGGIFSVETADGKCRITINAVQAPALGDWVTNTLAPVLVAWYPRVAALLASPGYTPPTHFSITLKPMPGVAFTSGRRVVASSDWLQSEIGREAVGSLVHEMVHVIQQFDHHGGHYPGWLEEGSADYVRWFKYEPQSHGADLVWIRHQGHFTPQYDASYRVTANFLNWVTEKYDSNIVSQLNAAMREGEYNDDLWKKYTGKTAPELGAEWKREIELQLAAKVPAGRPD